ncbi:MAG: CZB domain-containing protein, partial [Nitrospirota bacterium]
VDHTDADLIKLTKSDHKMWVQRIHNMLAGIEHVNHSDLASHRECRLGKWYYSKGAASHRGNSAFEALESPHEKIHSIGRQMAELYNQGKIADARALMVELEDTSRDIMGQLEALQQIV